MAGIMVPCITFLAQNYHLLLSTRFATIYAAITGKGFCEAAHEVSDILKRNLQTSIAVWAFPKMVLHGTVFCIGLVWAALIFIVVSLIAEFTSASTSSNVAPIAACCALVLAVILSLFVSMFIDIIEAIYLCYILDVDMNIVTSAEV
eukprot:gene4107-5082_t